MPDNYVGTAKTARIDVNSIGTRLEQLSDDLREIRNLISSAANTLFGHDPSGEDADKEERPPTVVSLLDRLERLAREIRQEANRF